MRSKIYLPDNDTIINKVQETLSRLFKSDIDTPSTSQNTTPSNKSSKGNANMDTINFVKVCRSSYIETLKAKGKRQLDNY